MTQILLIGPLRPKWTCLWFLSPRATIDSLTEDWKVIEIIRMPGMWALLRARTHQEDLYSSFKQDEYQYVVVLKIVAVFTISQPRVSRIGLVSTTCHGGS